VVKRKKEGGRGRSVWYVSFLVPILNQLSVLYSIAGCVSVWKEKRKSGAVPAA